MATRLPHVTPMEFSLVDISWHKRTKLLLETWMVPVRKLSGKYIVHSVTRLHMIRRDIQDIETRAIVCVLQFALMCSKCGFYDSWWRWELYVILHHSVLARSVRCQIGCHGETWAHVVCSSRHVLRGSDVIGHRSAGAPDEVASCLARWVVLGMLTRTDVFWDMRTVNVNRRREWILLLRDEIEVIIEDMT